MKSKKGERIIFLEGKKVNLRPLDSENDVEVVTRWRNDPEVRHFVCECFPRTKKDELEWLNEKSDNNIVLAIDTKKGNFIGIMDIHRINHLSRTATTGAMIGEKNYWSKGFGTDAKMILLNYAFNTLNLRKIGSRVFNFNNRSINYSKRCGYKEEGVLKKEHFIDGNYVDEILLAVFREDFLPLWEKYKNGSKK